LVKSYWGIIMSFTEKTISVPAFGEVNVHLDDNFKPLRIYVYAKDLQDASKDLEWLDDEDEKILCDPKNYRKGKNPLFVHLKDGFVRGIWAYIERWDSKDD